MPTKRTARSRAVQKLDPGMRLFLETGDRSQTGYPRWDDSWLNVQGRAAWDEHGEQITRAWIRKHPGSRPSAFWYYDAVRERPFRAPYTSRVMQIPSARDQLAYLKSHNALTATELKPRRKS